MIVGTRKTRKVLQPRCSPNLRVEDIGGVTTPRNWQKQKQPCAARIKYAGLA